MRPPELHVPGILHQLLIRCADAVAPGRAALTIHKPKQAAVFLVPSQVEGALCDLRNTGQVFVQFAVLLKEFQQEPGVLQCVAGVDVPVQQAGIALVIRRCV